MTRFVVQAARRRCIGSTKHIVTGLRSLLRFLHVAGHAAALADSVPTVAGWRGGALPRALPPAHLDRLLAGCDPGTADGRRDRAILMLLARLGLRIGELVRLELSDFEWRRGEVTIRGKARRQERLPLPAEVGEAIAAYILGGRTVQRAGRLFVSGDDPARALTAKRARAALREVCRRADIVPVGAHVLRHTAATEMLRAGASLIEVGQVLDVAGTDVAAACRKIGPSRHQTADVEGMPVRRPQELSSRIRELLEVEDLGELVDGDDDVALQGLRDELRKPERPREEGVPVLPLPSEQRQKVLHLHSQRVGSCGGRAYFSGVRRDVARRRARCAEKSRDDV